MGTQIMAVGGVRMFRYALGTLLLLAGMALLVAKGLVWLDLERTVPRRYLPAELHFRSRIW